MASEPTDTQPDPGPPPPAGAEYRKLVLERLATIADRVSAVDGRCAERGPACVRRFITLEARVAGNHDSHITEDAERQLVARALAWLGRYTTNRSVLIVAGGLITLVSAWLFGLSTAPAPSPAPPAVAAPSTSVVAK